MLMTLCRLPAAEVESKKTAKMQTLLTCSPLKERSSSRLHHADWEMLIMPHVQRQARQTVMLPVSLHHGCPTWPPFTV